MFDLHLITKLRKNKKNQLMTLTDRILLRRRAIMRVSLINSRTSRRQAFSSSQYFEFLCKVLCGLIVYSRKPSKPSLGLGDFLPLSAYPEFTLIIVSSELMMQFYF
jgi:hypothetical protein